MFRNHLFTPIRKAHQTDSSGEGLAQQLISKLSALEHHLDQQAATIARMEKRRALERALHAANAKDVPQTADAIEQHTSDPNTAIDISQSIINLKRTNPQLFRDGSSGAPLAPGAALSFAPEPASVREDPNLIVLRDNARKGDRASLLLYLRARREKSG